MASTRSKGLDYFSFDCIITDELKFIKAKHTNLGYGLFVSLLQKIHGEGYYIEWREMNMYVFAGAEGVDVSLLKDVIETCFQVNIFNLDLFEKHQILTSKEIQQRWKRAVISSKRKDTEIEAHLNLLENPELLQNNSVGFHSNADELQSHYRFLGQSNSKRESKGKETKSSECANAHTHKHEGKILAINNSTSLEKDENQNSSEPEQSLSARKKEKNCVEKEKTEKIQVRERVHLKPSEIELLKQELGEDDYNFVVDKLDSFKGAKGKTYKDDFCAIRNWGINALNEHKIKLTHLANEKQPNKRMEAILTGHATVVQNIPKWEY